MPSASQYKIKFWPKHKMLCMTWIYVKITYSSDVLMSFQGFKSDIKEIQVIV